VILGLGNLLLADEGVGVHVAHLLQQRELPSDVEVIDGGTGGFELIAHVRGKARVIIVDCVKLDATPGSVARLTLEDLALEQPSRFSVHDGGVRELLRHIRALSPAPDVVIIGVVPSDTDRAGLSLSPAVESALPRIVSAVVDEARLANQLVQEGARAVPRRDRPQDHAEQERERGVEGRPVGEALPPGDPEELDGDRPDGECRDEQRERELDVRNTAETQHPEGEQ
jgi:hydrogenase maturation protease